MNYSISEIKPFGLLLTPACVGTSLVEVSIAALRALVLKEQLIVLRGFETFTNAASFADYCEQWGEISLWPFGKVLELQEHEQPEDHIFDNGYVPLHWDGMYRPQIPELQMFHCVNAPLKEQGGGTLFSHTGLALRHASNKDKMLWSKVTGIYERKMAFYHSRTVAPVIDKHPYKDVDIIRYNEPPADEYGRFINPPDLRFVGIASDEIESFHTTLRAALYAPKSCYTHEWQTGDIVIADNFTLLHGRNAFESKSARHLRRVHILSQPPFQNPGLESFK